MYLISIDQGSYSLKIIEGFLERKNFIYSHHQEIPLYKAKKKYQGKESLNQLKEAILQDYLKSKEAKVITQTPHDLTTTRFLKLPVNSKKRAEMMIPFQLEEDLPFGASKIHYGAYLEKAGANEIHILASVANLEEFDEYYRELEEQNILPQILTSEISLFQNYITQSDLDGQFALVDLGHQTSKVYFVRDKIISAVHTSHIAGKVIDDVIAETYGISQHDAIDFKHHNSFILTEEQMDTVDADQKEFSKLMRRIFSPFFLDFKRWELGFRVDQRIGPDKVYLTGGSANIKNIKNFFIESTGLETLDFQTYAQNEAQEINLDEKKQKSFNLANTAIKSMANKKAPINLRNGQYSANTYEDIPLHSITFIGVRVGLVTAVLLLTLFIESIFLQVNEKGLSTKAQKIIKNPNVGLLKAEERQFRKKPEAVLSKLKKKLNVIEQEIKSVQAATKVNALNSLEFLSESLGQNENVDLINFDSSNNFTSATFKSTNPADLKKLESLLSSSALKGLKKEYIDNNLVISFED